MQELDIKVHRFLDEAGDTTFYGKHKLDIIGTNGVFELGEMKYYEQLLDKMALIVDLYDSSKYKDSKNYYRHNNLLTEANKILVLRGNLEL